MPITEQDLVGKTIKAAQIVKDSEFTDDKPYLDIECTDGSKFRIIANYGGYTGNSMDEYPRYIQIEKREEAP